ncbi:MAG: agmatine deiminase family protein [Prolixibacteraceae bacterium]
MKTKGAEMSIVWPAEWENQSAVQLTWPHKDTDWCDVLEEVERCYLELSATITRFQPLIVVAQQKDHVNHVLSDIISSFPIRIVEIENNDTWARDHSGISVIQNEIPRLIDYKFNGWGLKFPSNLDNQITSQIYQAGVFDNNVRYQNALDFVLEGGGIESDGNGTCMVTEACLLSPNRNETYSKESIEERLSQDLGVDRFLWLTHGEILGDDTDSHIDTLARFVSEDTIVYQSCNEQDYECYYSLKMMEEELRTFRTRSGEPYNLVALPWPSVKEEEGERLPATYANFLIINGAVLVPTYNDPMDQKVISILSTLFSDREVIGIDCEVLIKQHGSLHCVTMQYPEGFISLN